MSVKATNSVWERSRATGMTRLVLLAIADHADDAGRAWPSFARLAERCRMHRSSVARAIRQLIEFGELAVVEKGQRCGNIYQITIDTVTTTLTVEAPTDTTTLTVEPDPTGINAHPTGITARHDPILFSQLSRNDWRAADFVVESMC